MKNTVEIEKADAVNIGSINQINNAGGIGNDSLVYIVTTPKKTQQVCTCGEVIPRDAVIFEKVKVCAECKQKETKLLPETLTVVTTPRRIVKCSPCKRCKKGFAPSKLSNLLICKKCLSSARTETPAKQRRIIASIVAQFEASLRRQIDMGGAVNV